MKYSVSLEKFVAIFQLSINNKFIVSACLSSRNLRSSNRKLLLYPDTILIWLLTKTPFKTWKSLKNYNDFKNWKK